VELSERIISRAIIERYSAKLLSCLELDVAVVGAGPAGLVAAHDLAKADAKVAVFERKLSVGGGMWGGGMMFNEIVVQEEGKRVLCRFGVRVEPFEDGYFTADSVEAVTTICSRAVRAGARIFNSISIEDVTLRENRTTGLVLNWTAVQRARLHVDPLCVHACCVVDATGHDAEIVRALEKVSRGRPSGRVEGQLPMWAERGEQTTLENTCEVFPGVFVAGMCANATFGSYRMGPIFGGMLLSGEKVAKLILAKLERNVRSAGSGRGDSPLAANESIS
jgi:thiazole biosynthesis enzyme